MSACGTHLYETNKLLKSKVGLKLDIKMYKKYQYSVFKTNTAIPKSLKVSSSKTDTYDFIKASMHFANKIEAQYFNFSAE